MAGKKGATNAESSSLGFYFPAWMILWFIVTILIQSWDACFILLRPQSLPGGDLHYMFQPYKYFIEVDLKFSDMNDLFGVAHSILNVAEVFLLFNTLLLYMCGKRCAGIVAFMVQTMIFWKTVLYVLQYTSFIGGDVNFGTGDPMTCLMMFWLPGSFWIVMPFLCMISLGRQLVNSSGSGGSSSRPLVDGKKRK